MCQNWVPFLTLRNQIASLNTYAEAAVLYVETDIESDALDFDFDSLTELIELLGFVLSGLRQRVRLSSLQDWAGLQYFA